MSDAVLEFDSVSVEARAGDDSGIWQVSLRLLPGQLMLVRLEASARRVPIADAAQGLRVPDTGIVRYEGKSWAARSWTDAAAARGTIGRTFVDGGWVGTMDLASNITLSRRHHTRLSSQQIHDEATLLSRRFLLPGLPRGLPGQTGPGDLMAAACVRAFLGNPRLVILEWLTSGGAHRQLLGPLLSSVRGVLSRGGAVLWLTDDPQILSDSGITVHQRATMAGAQWVPMTAK